MNTATHPAGRARAQRGVTLIEALVALLVMALGMLAFAGLHSRLRLNSDTGRQRAEAVRLAEEDLENLRAFNSLANYDATVVTGTLASKSTFASDIQTTQNATYSISRSVVNTSDRMRQLRVIYQWLDRSGASQQVVLRSTVARIDPKLAAAMSIPPNGTPVRDLLGRSVEIPIPAKNLGNGTSVFKPSQGGGLAFVLSNESGYVTRKCTGITGTTQSITATTVQSGATGCTDLTTPGYLLSGYVRFSLTNSPNPTTPNDVPPGGLTIAVALDNDSALPSGSAPLGTLNRLNSSYWTPTPPSSTGYPSPAYECGAEDSKTVQYTLNNVSYSQEVNGTIQTVTSVKLVGVVPAATALTAAAIAPYVGHAEADISNVIDGQERYIGYACVMYPIDLNGVLAWTGRSTIVPSGWQIGALTGSWPSDPALQRYKVCRYSNDANLNGFIWAPNLPPASNSTTVLADINNAEHPNAYIRVTGGLSNQNFLVVRGTENCPTDGAVEVDGQGPENYTDETTVLHQSS